MKDRAFVLRIVVVYSPVECERRTRMAKRYEELTISDDFMFGKWQAGPAGYVYAG